jgi:glycosyltransferase involved in cell wall biosynthesis
MKQDGHAEVIAVSLKGFDRWGGGIGFIRLILDGLLHDPALTVVALIPRPTWTQRMRGFMGSMLRGIKGLSRGELRWTTSRPFTPEEVLAGIEDYLPRISARFHLDSPGGLVSALRACGATVVLPCMEPMPDDCPVAWVGYLYDFQHRHLPQFFTEAEQQVRDAAFERMLGAAPVVLCNSETVRRDAQRFHPDGSSAIVAMPFVAVPQAEWFEADPGVVQRKYGLPARYFIVCNQFWLHKDHPTAIRAYAEFLAHGDAQDVDLVCTGSQDDYRAPSYFASIQKLIADLGLGGRVHLLGRIPKLDQMALLRGAIALVQPTLFEGGRGGGAVYDALAVGVPALVSDIDINLELGEGSCQFFTRRDPSSLAGLMSSAAKTTPLRLSQGDLSARSHGMLGELHRTLVTAIKLAQASYHSS